MTTILTLTAKFRCLGLTWRRADIAERADPTPGGKLVRDLDDGRDHPPVPPWRRVIRHPAMGNAKGEPTATHGHIRLRCVTQFDPAQAALLDRLGVVLPKRMRLAQRESMALAETG